MPVNNDEILAALRAVHQTLGDLLSKIDQPAPPPPPPAERHTTLINDFSDGVNWLKGVWRKSNKGGFNIPATQENIGAFREGVMVELSNEKVFKIDSVERSGDSLFLFLDTPILDGNAVGAPRVLAVASSSASPDEPEVEEPNTPAPLPQPGPGTEEPKPDEPEQPEPAPEDPEPDQPDDEFIALTLKINNFNGKPDFEKGVWVRDDDVRVSVPKTTKSAEALKKGAKVKLADGKVRTVTQLQTIGDNHSVTMDGPKLEPAKVGHPGSLTTVTQDAQDDEPVDIEPAPAPTEPGPKPVPLKKLVNVNLGLGMGHEQVVPGKHGHHYNWPNQDEFKKVADDGFGIARCGGLWERWKLGGAGKGRGQLNHGEMDRMLQVAEYANNVGMQILWDKHNYSGYSATGNGSNSIRKKIGTPEVPIQALGDDWALALEYLWKHEHFRKATHGFDVMNEPIIPWATWKPALQHTINRIGAISDARVICEGINYSNTTNWVTNNPGMELLTHPKGKQYLEFHGHLYLDNGQDGFWSDGVETADKPQLDVARKRLKGFKEWGQKHGLNLGIGETMVPGIYPNHIKELDTLLGECVDAGIAVYLFFSARGAGNNWHNIYKPENAPTLKVIRKHLAKQK